MKDIYHIFKLITFLNTPDFKTITVMNPTRFIKSFSDLLHCTFLKKMREQYGEKIVEHFTIIKTLTTSQF